MKELRNQTRNFPENPGVYIFWQKNTPVYIGKAKNLKNRIASYFLTKLAPKTSRMLSEADSVTYIKVESELESLLLEANLIRKNQPKYNSVSKDDKHPLYIVITNDEYPQVLSSRKLMADSYRLAYGPFPSSSSVYSVLRMLRRIFPFADHKIGKRACLYSHIGLCNPCPNEILKIKNQKLKIEQKRKYLKNIKNIKSILSGRIRTVRKSLEREMAVFSKEEKFEEALVVREQLERLDYITQPIIPAEYFLENPNLTEDLRKKELKELKKILVNCKLKIKNLSRIECYDVAHLAGTNPTASMVTFINGEADKSYYRHFRIRQTKGADDIASLSEVAKRRIKYLEAWGIPDLIIVDGGKAQVKAFEMPIPVVGIAKNPDRLIIKDQKIRLRGASLRLVSRIRDEAHRFARRYHHKLIRRELLTPDS